MQKKDVDDIFIAFLENPIWPGPGEIYSPEWRSVNLGEESADEFSFGWSISWTPLIFDHCWQLVMVVLIEHNFQWDFKIFLEKFDPADSRWDMVSGAGQCKYFWRRII